MSNLTMTGFSDEKFTKVAPKPNVYEAMLNPESIQRGAGINYKKKRDEALRREILAQCERMLREHQARKHLER